MAASRTQRAIALLCSLRDSYPDGEALPDEINDFLAQAGAAAALFTDDENKPPSATTTRIALCPYEVQYNTQQQAQSHLHRVRESQNRIEGPESFTYAELLAEIESRGKLGIAVKDFYRAKGVNFFVFFAMAPSNNLAAADRDSWFEGMNMTQEEKARMWEQHEVPGHIIVVKVVNRVVNPPLIP